MRFNLIYIPVLILLLVNTNCSENKNVIKEVKIVDCETQIDSIKNLYIKSQQSVTIIKDSSQTSDEIKIYTLVGSFKDAALYDCFHLSFIDTTGKVWDFDNTDNIYGINLFDRTKELKLKKGVEKKKFKLWYAILKGIDCQSADSYFEENKKYVNMPTIIKIEEL